MHHTQANARTIKPHDTAANRMNVCQVSHTLQVSVSMLRWADQAQSHRVLLRRLRGIHYESSRAVQEWQDK